MDRRSRMAARQVWGAVGPEFLATVGNRPLPGGISAVSFKQLLMNFLRASPERPCDAARLLQLFIFSCCGVNFFVSVLAAGAGAASAGLALRHSLRNFLYASPLRPLFCSAQRAASTISRG